MGQVVSTIIKTVLPIVLQLLAKEAAVLLSEATLYQNDNPNQNYTEIYKDTQIYAQNQFLKKYSYSYAGDNSNPTYANPGSPTIGRTDLAVAKNEDFTSLGQYLDSTFTMPPGTETLKKQFYGDLQSMCQELASKENTDWETIAKTFSYPLHTGEDLSIDMIITYASGEGSDGKYNFFRYVSVIYKSTPWFDYIEDVEAENEFTDDMIIPNSKYIGKLRVVFKNGNINRIYSGESLQENEKLESRYYGEVTFNYKEKFANVIGSTSDPKVAGLSWIQLWRNQFGDISECTSLDFMTSCNNNLVGGHVIPGTVAKKIAVGSNIWIVPICSAHNNNDKIYMETLTNLKGIALTNYMQCFQIIPTPKKTKRTKK